MAACDEVRADLDRYLDGEIDRDGREAVERHLAACAECRRAVEERRAAMALLSEWSREPAAPARPAAGRGSRVAVRLALAAAVLLAAGVYLSYYGSHPTRLGPTGGQAVAGAGHRLHWHTLADGAKVVPGKVGESEELVVEAFPSLNWRSLSSGVEVVSGKSGEPVELVVDPFPEEGK